MTLVADLSGTSRRLVCDQTQQDFVGDPGLDPRLRQSLVWSGRVAVVGFSLKCTESRAIARKPRDAAAVRCSLKLTDTY